MDIIYSRASFDGTQLARLSTMRRSKARGGENWEAEVGEEGDELLGRWLWIIHDK